MVLLAFWLSYSIAGKDIAWICSFFKFQLIKLLKAKIIHLILTGVTLAIHHTQLSLVTAVSLLCSVWSCWLTYTPVMWCSGLDLLCYSRWYRSTVSGLIWPMHEFGRSIWIAGSARVTKTKSNLFAHNSWLCRESEYREMSYCVRVLLLCQQKPMFVRGCSWLLNVGFIRHSSKQMSLLDQYFVQI